MFECGRLRLFVWYLDYERQIRRAAHPARLPWWWGLTWCERVEVDPGRTAA
jgi:hypothetical protein